MNKIGHLVFILSACIVNGAHIFAQGINKPDSFLFNKLYSFLSAETDNKQIIYRSGCLNYDWCIAYFGLGLLCRSGNKRRTRQRFKNFHTNIDNYLQFAPIAAGYALLINNKQHNFWKYTEKVAITEVITTGLMQSVKRITKIPRPDTGEPTSFPSGHTAQAFAGATLFCDEFAQHNTWLTITTYTSATAVGMLRVLNNRHWISDVAAGAGFGILSAKLSEWIVEPHSKKRHSSYNLP